MNCFLDYVLSVVSQKPNLRVVYFHNLSRFDGIFIMNHIRKHRPEWVLKPLMRNREVYQIEVRAMGKNILFRDSLRLLPGSLSKLGESLCPELGKKGEVDHSKVSIEKLKSQKDILIEYMKQDIYLLGGVMKEVQDIYYKLYSVDITTKITLSSLSLTIFRKQFYNERVTPVSIPNRTADEFIRRGYYGGHADVYKPYGKDLFYYDVNSLYPSAMARNSMPIGKPTWVGDLSHHNLEDIYGFVEAYVHCPKSMKKPFLPYRKDDGSLIFPTGRFFGVFYSEELKKAKEVGYQVEPLRGYLYKKVDGLFTSFVDTLYLKRSQAKKDGKVGMSFVFKILMNSLYGRFGINLVSTVTELCSRERHIQLEQGIQRVVSAIPLTEKSILCSYWSEPEDGSCDWFRKLGAVQIAAAITSHARIYMYEFISREDSYYTDTDSVVLKNPLPPDMICNYTLGKFKLEHKVKEGYFLAPKSYSLTTDKDEVKLVNKGAGVRI